MEHGDLTLKLLGSYGRATRSPSPDRRLRSFGTATGYEPSLYVAQFENPNLKPEHSRGPQGGLELYYGNLGSLTINHYQQIVTDLIQNIAIDTVEITQLSSGSITKLAQRINLNVGSMRQQGWETTSSLNLGALALKGTYSWIDSRIRYRNTNAGGIIFPFDPSGSFVGLPTHTGNFTLTYAAGGTSLTWATNYTGRAIGRNDTDISMLRRDRARINTYYERLKFTFGYRPTLSYVKSNVGVSHRMNGWTSATLNVTNVTNDFTSDAGDMFPSLGRQTLLGLSLRFPRR
jgi:hypothetical protein